MDFAATVDMKNPSTIDWKNYPITSGKFYESRGSLELVEVKKSVSFPTPDAQVIVILHKDHKIYYSPNIRHSEERRIQISETLDPSQVQDDGNQKN